MWRIHMNTVYEKSDIWTGEKDIKTFVFAFAFVEIIPRTETTSYYRHVCIKDVTTEWQHISFFSGAYLFTRGRFYHKWLAMFKRSSSVKACKNLRGSPFVKQ